MPGGKAIAGLRQQIIANAIVLFPKVATTHQREYSIWHKRQLAFTAPTEAFDVVVLTVQQGNQYQAFLTYGPTVCPCVAAESSKKDTVNAAVCSLLEVTAKALEARGGKALRGIVLTDRAVCGGGMIDAELLCKQGLR
ncbi:hypothetical protein LTR85_007795 [Meristemomyces frigidus]|nr:hypothetical protein LTR85_007795 [Meristemomyces frigidus]